MARRNTQVNTEEAAEKSDGPPGAVVVSENTNLARFRTSLALDRTTLAWIRTAVTFVTFGLGMIAFFRTVAQATHTEQSLRLHQGAIRLGVALVAIGMVATILVAFSHWTALRRLRRGEQLSVARWPVAVTIAALISILGVYGLWSVLAQ
jgi:putative membrane protein